MNTKPPLDGRAAMVIGGSRGIGAAVVRRLARDGADVGFTYVTAAAAADELVAEVERTGRRALALPVDSADAAALSAAVDIVADRFGRLDVLVNNAALYPVGPIDELTVEEFDRTVAVNVRAPFVAATAAARHMTGGGSIVTIGSLVAERTVFPGYGLYSMSKTALVGLTKGLARDLGGRGIRATLVHPGPTDTDLNPADGPYSDTIRSHTALGRYAGTDEIAATVAHLAGDDGRYITGTSVLVDGGFTI
ncbi:SDR family NAD(P)-dependent oxidoreductase [Jiangella sp. DSM 45060]|uniref:SDR family NAD(P)-dependent oxidoreductase n=1 Tax=Jiangella sp. DSM 45060 TaxID=1798224 RepID=UPI00087DBF11|nr:SDR family oxidoreductase [Jiangella sp. DSM 45060]SDT73145.1 3-oxoacyl-[acyl-carrier protein] reductase [Jiangella sp. DSM 45060]